MSGNHEREGPHADRVSARRAAPEPCLLRESPEQGQRRTPDGEPLFDHACTFTTLFYPDAANGALLPSLRAAAFKIGLADAGAVAALRQRALEQGRLTDVESAIEAAYAPLTLDSGQEAFDAFRRAVSGLW